MAAINESFYILIHSIQLIVYNVFSVSILKQDVRRSSGGGGYGPNPLIIHKKYRVSKQYGTNPLENHKPTKRTFNVEPPSARQRNAI